jgi:hypothetical protein
MKDTILFEVHGKGIFPIDMLRHDCAYPVDAESVEAIYNVDQLKTVREVTLIGSMRFPTEGRWKSFGWEVIGWDHVDHGKTWHKDERTSEFAHRHLLRHFLRLGYGVSVQDPDWKEDEEERVVKYGLDNCAWLISEIEGWDGGQDFLLIHPKPETLVKGKGRHIWVGMAMGYGNEKWESVYDYTARPEMEEWWSAFQKVHRDE